MIGAQPVFAGIVAAANGQGGGGGSGSDLAGDMKLILHANSKTISTFVFSNVYLTTVPLPAISPVINPYTMECEHIYQRFKIEDGSGDVADFRACAIDGEYAICCKLADFSRYKYVAVVPCVADSDLMDLDEWNTNALTVGTDVTLIEVDGTFFVIDVCMVKQGEFIILSQKNGSGGKIYNMQYVKYTSPTDHEISLATVDLSASAYTFLGSDYSSPLWYSINYETLEFACYITCNGGSISCKVDLTTLVVSELTYGVDGPALRAMSSTNESSLDWQGSNPFSGIVTASHKNLYLNPTNYGRVIEKKTYASRSLTGASVTYEGAVDSSHYTALLINAKITSLGYTLNSEFDPAMHSPPEYGYPKLAFGTFVK